MSEVFITLFEHFFYFLVIQESSSSFCILSALDPESTILSRSLVSFTWGIKLENKNWVQMVCFSFILTSILTGRYYPVNSLDGFHYNLHGSFNEYEEKHTRVWTHFYWWRRNNLGDPVLGYLLLWQKNMNKSNLRRKRVYFFLRVSVYHVEKSEQDQKLARTDTGATEECHWWACSPWLA